MKKQLIAAVFAVAVSVPAMAQTMNTDRVPGGDQEVISRLEWEEQVKRANEYRMRQNAAEMAGARRENVTPAAKAAPSMMREAPSASSGYRSSTTDLSE